MEGHSEYKIKAHNEKAQYPKNLPKAFPGIQKNSQNCEQSVHDEVKFANWRYAVTLLKLDYTTNDFL